MVNIRSGEIESDSTDINQPKLGLRNLTWKQLRAFAATVRCGSVTGAAEVLCVTPPAVSIQLKILEDSIGAPIFQRTAGSMFTPTEIGDELNSLALKMEKMRALTIKRIDEIKYGTTRPLILGASYTAKYLAPAFVAEFKRTHPEIEISLVVRDRKYLISALEHHKIDFVMTSRVLEHSEIESVTIGDHPYIVIASPDHKLNKNHNISIDDLRGESILMRESGSHTRILTESYFESTGKYFNTVETGSNETIKHTVMAGSGVAILPAHTCINEIETGRLIMLAIPGLPQKKWLLLYNIQKGESKIDEEFKNFMFKCLSQIQYARSSQRVT